MMRLAGALALVGGVAWLVKLALIWENGGTNTTGGTVGVLFDIGAIAIVSAAVLAAWSWRSSASVIGRLLAALLAIVAFVLVVNVPIVIGWQIFGRTWFAEEVGVLVTALLALVLGQRWLRAATA